MMKELLGSIADRMLTVFVPKVRAEAGCGYEFAGCCDWKVAFLWNFCTGDNVCVVDHSGRCT